MTWTIPSLQRHLLEVERIRVSYATVRRALRKLGYRYKRPRLSLKHKQNPALVKKARRERDAALKKGRSIPSGTPWSFKTSASSTSIPA